MNNKGEKKGKERFPLDNAPLIKKELGHLGNIALKNLAIAVDLLKKLEKDSVETYVRRECNISLKISSEEFKDSMSLEIETIVEDSRKVLREQENFLKFVDGERKLTKKDCPFLRKVWLGMVYECKGKCDKLDGLQNLKKDLSNTTLFLKKGLCHIYSKMYQE